MITIDHVIVSNDHDKDFEIVVDDVKIDNEDEMSLEILNSFMFLLSFAATDQ